jgi:hypothetical protein
MAGFVPAIFVLICKVDKGSEGASNYCANKGKARQPASAVRKRVGWWIASAKYHVSV